jgi:multiple sugar transport system substrate-binding protein
MDRIRHRRHVALALTAGATLAATAACGGSGGSTDPGGAANAPVTISVNCEPPTTQASGRKGWTEDVAAFEKLYPYITVKSDDQNPCDNPATFDAQLAGGKMDNVFYTYFTDADNVIDSGQSSDIQKYASQITDESDIQPSLMDVYRQGNSASGDLYGIPTGNYSLGLVYNRTLFQQAGLNPNDPPTTWAQVETDAIAISKLGNGIAGYGDYSAANTGGWHFVAELYSRGGSAVTANGQSADFDNATGEAVLNYLHQLRFVDNVMGTNQGLQYNDLLQLMASGKLGMYIGAPDNVTSIHSTYNVPYANLGVGPMPGEKATLLGGSGYMFNKKDTAAQIQAGIKWIDYEFMTSGKGQFDWQRLAQTGQPVGLPEPDLWQGAAASANARNVAKYANIPTANFAAYVAATPKMKLLIEPPQAQSIYAKGDAVMDAVLTDSSANIPQLLSTFSGQVNTILANAQP